MTDYNEIMRKLDYLYHWNDCCLYPIHFNLGDDMYLHK